MKHLFWREVGYVHRWEQQYDVPDNPTDDDWQMLNNQFDAHCEQAAPEITELAEIYYEDVIPLPEAK